MVQGMPNGQAGDVNSRHSGRERDAARTTAGGQVKPDGGRHAPEPGQALDWTGILARLDLARHRWDLGILANLDEDDGRQTAELLARVNRQAGGRHRLTPQVLSVRLRALEARGFIRHADRSRLPLVRVYMLQPPGRERLRALSGLASWDESQPDRRARAAGR
jgi:DNA-binding HxlR family transcriptional regulator